MSAEPTPPRRKRRRGRPSMQDVADLAGVAMASVSRVLSDHPDASEEMHERVMRAVDELGYEPDLLAQSLRRSQTFAVGFVVRDISNPVFAEIASGAEATLREAGYAMVLTNSEGRPELDAEHLRLFERRRVDGLLLSTVSEDDPRTLRILRNLETPAVVLDRDLPADVGVGRVLFDHRVGMREAVSHLLSLGHRRISFISGAPLRPTHERRAGLEEAFRSDGLRPTFDVIEGIFSALHGEQAMRTLLARPTSPTAVIVGGNELLAGVLPVIADTGLALGRAISLVSCDDVALTRVYRPEISVIARDNREMGRTAAELLLAELRSDQAGGIDVVRPTRYLPRPSCGPV